MAYSSRSKSRTRRRTMKRRRTSNSNISKTFARPEASLPQLRRHNKLSKLSGEVYQKLDDSQMKAVAWLLETKRAALYADQGTGKTWMTCGLIEQLVKQRPFTALIVVPLNNLESTWVSTLGELFPYINLTSDPESHEIWGGIMLLNYEQVPKHIKWLQRQKWSLIVYDEAQRLKDRGSVSSRKAMQLGRTDCEYKVILTGTPFDKNPKDLWAQFRFIRPELLGSWKEFEAKYLDVPDLKKELRKCRRGSLKFQLTLRRLVIQKGKAPFREEMLDEFLREVSPYIMRIDRSLPVQLKTHAVPVMLDRAQRRLYDRLEGTCVLDEHNISTPFKMTQIWKLHQVCGGVVLDDEGRTVEVGYSKLKTLLALIEQLKLPIVIFAYYTAEIDILCEELAPFYRVGVISGATKKQRPAIIKQFQSGKLDILICQNRSGGVGIDLFRSHCGMLYSFRHSWIDFDQILARLHRRGQESDVDFYLLFARDTVDEDIYYSISGKGDFVKSVFQRLKNRRESNGKKH